MGLDFLRYTPSPSKEGSQNFNSKEATSIVSPPSLLLHLKHKNGEVDARAIESDGEIIVLEGSLGTTQENKVNQYAPLRQQLINEGKITLLPTGGIRFAEDVPFKSPSAAAAVLNNRNSAGPREWRVDGTEQTLGEWRDSLLEDVHLQSND